jgi:DNA-binding SARP family transcriptional activator
MIEILKCLAFHYEQEHDYPRAIHYAQRAIELEPWSEDLHCRKMEILAWSNQRVAALRQYELCRQILAEELGVEPGIETTNLYQQIRSGTHRAGYR